MNSKSTVSSICLYFGSVTFLIILFILILKATLFKSTFLSSKETAIILIENKDKYYQTFTRKDFEVRNVSDVEGYKKKIKTSTIDLKFFLKIKILITILSITTIHFFKKLLRIKFHKSYVVEKIIELPWKFGFINDTSYENGLPHTRIDTIILQEMFIKKLNFKELRELLIHEKVHIFQKKYPTKTKEMLVKMGFKIHNIRDTKSNIRANPDINQIIYIDSTHKIYKAEYTKNAKSITDVKYTFHHPKHLQISEHPFEKMALEITDNF